MFRGFVVSVRVRVYGQRVKNIFLFHTFIYNFYAKFHCLRAQNKLVQIQRRLAWPLCKDDTQTSEYRAQFFFPLVHKSHQLTTSVFGRFQGLMQLSRGGEGIEPSFVP